MAAAQDRDAASSSQTKDGEKKSHKKIYFLVGVAVLALIIWTAMQDPKGTIKLGICEVFIQRTLTYPLQFRLASAYEKANEVRMEFTTTNEYGEYILSPVICIFRPDPETIWALSEVQVNRIKLPENQIAAFNPTIPAIVANPPDLTLPPQTLGSLMELQR